MASVDCRKMTAKACSGMMYHLDDEKRKEVHHSNKHINKELTHLNSWVGCSNFSEMKENMNRNVAEIDSASPPRREKDDRNINISFYMVCPKELTDAGLSEEFFEKLYEFIGIFCEKKYGKAYPCGMAVHRDEIHEYLDHGWDKRMSLEHGHMWVTPYAKWIDQRTVYGEDGKPLREAPTEEEKAKNPKAKGKIVKESYTAEGLNAKHFLNKTFLKELQQEVDAFIFQEYGIHYLTNETPLNMTVEELKLKSEQAAAMLDRAEHEAAAIVKEAEIEAEQIRKKNQELSDQNEILEKSIQDKKTEESNIDTRLEQKTAKEKALDANISTTQATIDTLNTQKSNIEADISILDNDLEERRTERRTLASEKYRIKQEISDLDTQKEEAEEQLKEKNDALEALSTSIQPLQTQVDELKTKKTDLEDEIEILQSAKTGVEAEIRLLNDLKDNSEEEINKILIPAQNEAETLVSEAHQEATKIINEANLTVQDYLDTKDENELLKTENEAYKDYLKDLKQKIDDFYWPHHEEPLFQPLRDILTDLNGKIKHGIIEIKRKIQDITSNLGH